MLSRVLWSLCGFLMMMSLSILQLSATNTSTLFMVAEASCFPDTSSSVGSFSSVVALIITIFKNVILLPFYLQYLFIFNMLPRPSWSQEGRCYFFLGLLLLQWRRHRHHFNSSSASASNVNAMLRLSDRCGDHDEDFAGDIIVWSSSEVVTRYELKINNHEELNAILMQKILSSIFIYF